jgi:phosphoglycolate phosphatase-like HAD superfamily hydrolase
LNLPPERIVYVGDNLNDFEAGLATGVRLIGFAVEEKPRERLLVAGASMVSADHQTTFSLIEAALA